MQSLQGEEDMRNPGRYTLAIVLSVFLSVACSGIAFPSSAAIIEAAVNVHLQVVNRCAMSLVTSANNARINVHCNRPVAYHIRVNQEPVQVAQQQQFRRVVISY